MFESVFYSDVAWGIHVPQGWPKVAKRVDFRIPPGLVGHPILATFLIWDQQIKDS